MTSNRRPRLLVLAGACAVLFLWLSSPPDLRAQDEDNDPEAVAALATVTPAEVGERGADVLRRLDQILKNGKRLSRQLAASSGEDSLVTRLQRARSRDRFMAAMVELADIVARSKDDPALQELTIRAEDLFRTVTPEVWNLIGSLRTEIDQLRARRPDTPPNERPALEDQIVLLSGRLDKFFDYAHVHVQKLESFGGNAQAERDTLVRLLAERADELSGRLDLDFLRIREFNSRLKETPGDADVAALLLATRKSLDANVASQTNTLGIMEKLGQPTEIYRAQLITMTQDIAAGLLDAKVAAKLARQAMAGIRTWLVDRGPSFLVKMILFLVIVFAGRFLAAVISRIVEKSLLRTRLNMSNLLKRMTVSFTKNAISLLALVFALAQLGVSLGPMLAGFGVVGFILGFAMQDSLSNLAAGMMILINRPYDVGDLVEISGVFGKVEQMSMVSTSVLTLDNQKLVVPNSKIWGDVIKNVTDQRVRRVDMTFSISYSDDIPHAERVLNDILESHVKVLENPEPMVRLHTLNESSVDFIVRPWVKTDDYWEIYWDVTREVKMRFDAEGISIPFPQRDVHIYEQKKLARIPAPGAGEEVARKRVDLTGQDDPDVGDT